MGKGNKPSRGAKPPNRYSPSPISSQTSNQTSNQIDTPPQPVFATPPSLTSKNDCPSSSELAAITEKEINSLIEQYPDSGEGRLAKEVITAISKIMKTYIAFSQAEAEKLKLKISALENELGDLKRKNLDEPHREINPVAGLKDRYVAAEKQIFKLEQYGRRNNVEFSGIPNSVEDDHLESAMINILSDIGVSVKPSDIEVCHRMGKSSGGNSPRRTIMRFVNRKICYLIMVNKKKLRDIDSEKHSLGNNKIYANFSLCKAYGSLWYNCKKLFHAEEISGFWVANGGMVKFKMEPDSDPILLEHQADLDQWFPDFDFAAPIAPKPQQTPSSAWNKNKHKKKKPMASTTFTNSNSGKKRK